MILLHVVALASTVDIYLIDHLSLDTKSQKVSQKILYKLPGTSSTVLTVVTTKSYNNYR